MAKKLVLLVLSFAFWHGTASAQVLEYIDCQVSDPAAFIAASDRFFNAMSGGVRPTVSIDENLWNGSSPVTHTVIVAYNGHRDLEAFLDRVRSNRSAYEQLVQSVTAVASCDSEGLAVELNAWGDPEAEWEYYAVYPVMTSDPARYGTALETLVASIISDAPGAILYYQNRAGRENVSHFVVFLSPSLAGLNEFLDGLQTSRAYARFLSTVTSIRTIDTAAQARSRPRE